MDELLGESHAIGVVREQALKLLARGQRAHRLPPILLQGETGTGKGLLARLLHRGGPRRDAPFIDVSCAAIPEALLEAELFGFERGAFTDARHAKAGLLHAAHRGTIFLDELALLPEAFQAKLLKAIDERAVRRLGSTRAETVDVQIMAASNEDLAAAVRSRRFRNDLYHRLAVVTLTLPPLRERREDVVLLAEHFLSRACADYGLAPPRQFAPEARSALQEYHWPGNVRELSNVVESAVLLAEKSTITAPMLRLPPKSSTVAGWSRFDDRLGDLECEQLLGALRDTNWNISRAARALGISRSRLRYRIDKRGLHADRDLQPSGRWHARSTEPAASTSAVDPETDTKTVELRCERQHLAFLRAELVPIATAAPLREGARALAVMAEKIRGFGGCIQEATGVTIAATFGLEPAENAPDSAALAALAIQKAAERARRVDPRVPAVKIAIHAAQLMVDRVNGIAQSGLESKGSAEAPLAALIDAGQANSIFISATAAPFLERRFELARLPCRDGTEPFYRLIGAERIGFGLGGRALVPFVGRQREIAIVSDQLAQAERARGQIVAVVGEPGVGKSRFVYEMARADRVPGWRVLSCRAFSYGVTTPLLPVVELLKSYFSIEDRDDAGSMRQKATDRLLTLDRQFEASLLPLLSVLDVPLEDPHWQRLDPAQKRLRTMEACKRLLLRESQGQPLLLVFEDLHWIDNETQALLDGLIDSLPTARVLLVVSYRPEYQHHWSAKTYYTQLRIDPLTDEGAQVMLHALLGDDPSLLAVRRLLIERTEGNPLFLEESVRTLMETGALHGSRGACRLAAPATSIEVPATVQAILAARIDRLSPDDKGLLQAASVIGRDIPYSLLQSTVGLPEERLHQHLRVLQVGEFLYEKSSGADLEYTFKHALTHEVAYDSVLQERRTELHERIIESIERLYDNRLAEQIERLAHHALRGEVWEKALVYLRQAAEKAIGRSANREAWSHVEQAMLVLSHLPGNKVRLEQAIDLRLAVRTCLSPLGEFTRALELGREAVALAKDLDDPRRETLIHCSVSISLSHMGRSAEAIEHGERAMAIAEALGEPMLRIAARHSLGVPHYFLGAHRTAIGFFQRDVGLEPEQITARLLEPWGAEVFQDAFARVSYSHSLANAAYSLAELGEFDQAMVYAERAVKFAQTLDILYLRAIADAHLGWVCLGKGELQEALLLAQRWLRSYAAADLLVPQLVMAARLAEVFGLSGQIDDAIALCERAWQLAESKKVFAFAPPILVLLGDAYARAGRIDEALTTAQRALDLARQLGQRGDEARALHLLGNVQCHVVLGNANRARDSCQQALVLAHELSMRPLQAQCHLALGELARKAGERRGAQEQLGKAVTMFRGMGMKSLLEKAEAAHAAL
jgi:transcriptional regulator with AAA-type ATPase domain/tetratricopeptide (TPR) repeat protein